MRMSQEPLMITDRMNLQSLPGGPVSAQTNAMHSHGMNGAAMFAACGRLRLMHRRRDLTVL